MAVGYFLLAALWIFFSDRLVAGRQWPDWAQTAKGWLFVSVTAVGLYLVTARFTRYLLALHAELRRHADQLETRVAERTDELLQANRELDLFAHAASHDLRAPLRAVSGFATAVAEDYGGRLDDTGRDYLRRIVAGAERMDALVTDLRDYNRLARRSVALEPVMLDQAVTEVLELFREDLARQGGEVRVERPLARVMAEPDLLRRALQNLVDNALKFTPAGEPPRVTIRSVVNGGRARVEVEDRGIGVPADRAAALFEPFERLHGDDAYPGTGLGLAIVRRSATRMGGSAGLAPGDGKGSRFWIELETATGKDA